MNVNAFPIGPVSLLAVGGELTRPGSSPSQDLRPFGPALADAHTATDRVPAKRADNNTNLPGSIRERGHEFSRALREKGGLKTNRSTPDQVQLKANRSTSEEDLSAGRASLELAQKQGTEFQPRERGVVTAPNDICRSQAALADQLTGSTPTSLAEIPDTVATQALELAVAKSEQLESQTPSTEEGLVQGEEVLKGVPSQNRSDILSVLDTAAPQSQETTSPALNMASVAVAKLTDRQDGEELVSELPNTVAKAGDGGAKPLPADATLPMSESNIAGSEPKVPDAMSRVGSTIEEQADSRANIADAGQREPGTVPQKITDGDSTQARSELLQTSGQASSDDSSSDASPKKLNVSDADVSGTQVKPPVSPTAENGSNPDLGQVLSQDNAHTLVTEQSVTAPQVAKNAADVAANDVSTGVAGQIQEHIHHSLQAGDRQITIHLYPPELGKVFVRFQEQDDQIIGVLEVSKTQTRYEIEQTLPQVIQNLQAAGVEVKRLEVVLTDQPGQETHKDHSLQDGLFDGSLQSQGFSQSGKHSDNAGSGGWVTGEDLSYQENPEPYLQVSGNSINMLI